MHAEAGVVFQQRLARSRSSGNDASEIAHAAFATWREIEAILSPIIGARGVAALYQRSLSLNRSAYPFFPLLSAGDLDAANFAALRAVLAQQSSATATGAGSALLQTFYTVLSKLIGESLTGQLLQPLVASHASGTETKESP